MPTTGRFFRRPQLEARQYIVGYPNKPACGDTLLSGNGLNSFDSAFLLTQANIGLITAGSSILAMTCMDALMP